MEEQAIFEFLSEASPGVLQFGRARMAVMDLGAGFWSIRVHSHQQDPGKAPGYPGTSINQL
jgi:hypothetical protein